MVAPDGKNVKRQQDGKSWQSGSDIQVFKETEVVFAMTLAVVHGRICLAEGTGVVEMLAGDQSQAHAAGQHVVGVGTQLFQEVGQALFQAFPRDAAPDVYQKFVPAHTADDSPLRKVCSSW